MSDDSTQPTPDGTSTDGTPEGEPEGKTLSQAEVDRIVQQRLAKERSKYADYDDLKQAAARLQELEDANKSELERAVEQARQEALQTAEQKFAAERLADRLRVAAARKLNDPEDAVRLIDTDGLTEDGITEAVDRLVEQKPYLAVQQQAPPSGSADATSRPTGSGNHISVGAAIKALRGS
jgi:hypothetical protein